MLMEMYTCPECKGTGIKSNENAVIRMPDADCVHCAGTGKLTEVEAINRGLIPNPMFAGVEE